MAMNAGASLPAARQLCEQVAAAGGVVPPVLTQLLDAVTLLAEHPAPRDPVKPIVAAAAAGELTDETLTELLAAAARDAAAADYRGSIRARVETAVLDRFHRALVAGAADEILDSLRESFTEAATQLTDALATVDTSVDPRQLADQGTAEELAAYRSIRPAVQRLDEIASLAALFGPRSISWAVIDQPDVIEMRGVVDEALMTTDSDLMQAGAAFRARRSDIRSSPWLRLTPRLNSISQAKERLRQFAETAWDELNANPPATFDERGNTVPIPRTNPYEAVDA
ncbi:hypothetical protein [Mycolicibacterium gadium]|uniref:Uncharacterized protein n=1 Tax=Mycolicibacterium gadium TaxID=1794 RepID=A0A7I7WIX2_MYCGU|nr:hypothetical protein [Mycolicibacterium gadium]BBZ17080.1 hypothetical protein MGAD_14150 [Mycolicibacterium gadium]